jgi:hypothetical protein
VRLIDRLTAREKSSNTAPMLTMEIDGLPTDDQTAMIDRCTRTGRRLLVFCMPGDIAWMPGHGVPQWEAKHGNA